MEAKLKRWIAATGNPDKLFLGAVKDNETEILDANTAQLSVGKDSMGRLLEEYESDAYAKMKKGPPFNSKAPMGIPNLYLEGDFYEGFTLKYSGYEMTITSTDVKTDRLVAKYGEDIFGLSEEQLKNLSILESFLIAFRNELQ